MAKVTAPLLSMSASGQIGKTQVYASWRGVPYARRYVTPANPKTTSQGDTRSIFLWLNESWKLMNSAVQAVWTAAAKGQPMTDRNLWQQANLPTLRNAPPLGNGTPLTTITDLKTSPGVNAGIAYQTLAPTDGGSHIIDAALTAPTLPAGWTITAAHAVAWLQQNASTATTYASYYATKTASAWTPAVQTPAAGTYVVSGFFEYTKPDGSIAYSPSITATVTVA